MYKCRISPHSGNARKGGRMKNDDDVVSKIGSYVSLSMQYYDDAIIQSGKCPTKEEA